MPLTPPPRRPACETRPPDPRPDPRGVALLHWDRVDSAWYGTPRSSPSLAGVFVGEPAITNTVPQDRRWHRLTGCRHTRMRYVDMLSGSIVDF